MAKNRPVKILIVDDNDLMRTLLRGILRNEEYHIIGEARNGAVALEFVERDKPDLICMDVMMPEMDGLEALQSIKSTNPEIIVIMITGNPSKENVQESIKGGANGFIIKPFNAAKVLDTLKKALLAPKPASSPTGKAIPVAAQEQAVNSEEGTAPLVGNTTEVADKTADSETTKADDVSAQ
jgi:two-component system chemotaxis response regulator CheY